MIILSVLKHIIREEKMRFGPVDFPGAFNGTTNGNPRSGQDIAISWKKSF